MQASKPPSSLALCSFPTKPASAATSKAIVILRYRQLRISARASQGAPEPPTQEKEAEKATKRRRQGHNPAPAHGTRPRLKSAAVARGRPCPAPDAADASCRPPERL